MSRMWENGAPPGGLVDQAGGTHLADANAAVRVAQANLGAGRVDGLTQIDQQRHVLGLDPLGQVHALDLAWLEPDDPS